MRILRPNTATVAAKVIDGEAIIMNLSTGAYYSMDGAGAVVWELLEGGSSAEALSAGLAARYGLESGAVQADLERLVAELLREELILGAEESAAPDPPPRRAATAQPYAAPILNKYTEMADLLALDPPMPAIGRMPAGPSD